MIADEIVPGDRSGGSTTSGTIIVPALTQLLNSVGRNAEASDYEQAVLEDNVLGKETAGSRKRTLRALRELYLLRPDSILFRALRDLWTEGPEGQPLIAGLCALARDPVFRASSSVILSTDPGDDVTAADLTDAVDDVFPDAYNESSLAKIGRNTSSSWEQTGHLNSVTRTEKVRQRPVCTPGATAFALLLGHLAGARSEALFSTLWAQALDRPRSHLFELATVASQRSFIDLRHSGGVTEIRFTELLRPIEGQML